MDIRTVTCSDLTPAIRFRDLVELVGEFVTGENLGVFKHRALVIKQKVSELWVLQLVKLLHLPLSGDLC